MSDLVTEPGVGSIVAGVRLEETIGRGGMGVVFRGHQLALHRTVALKMIRSGLSQSERFRARFLRECENAASLDNPHVVPIYAVDEHEGHPVVLMRYVEGVDLAKMINAQGPLALPLAVEIVTHVADALDAAHRQLLVHRDVKPANILVTSGSARTHTYLTDFGISQAAADTRLTETGVTVGTIDYMAPEQYSRRTIDGRADVYALGCVVFEAVTGSLPFDRDNDPARMWAHLHEPPPSVRVFDPRLPPALETAVGRALAKDPDQRFATAGAFATAVAEAAATMDDPDETTAFTIPARRPAPAVSITRAPAVTRDGAGARGRGATPVSRPRPSRPGLPPAPSDPPPAGPPTPPPSRRPGPAPASSVPTMVGPAAAAERVDAAGLEVAAPTARRRPRRRFVVVAGMAAVLVVLAAAAVLLLPQPPASVVGTPIAVGANPIYVEEGAGFIWTANADDGTISKIDPATGTSTAIPVGGRPAQVQVDAGVAWVRNTGTSVTRVDVATGAQAEVSLGDIPVAAIVAGDGSLYASQPGADAVVRVDGRTNTVVETIPTGPEPSALAFDNHRLFVATAGDRSLTAVATSGSPWRKTVPLPALPGGIVWTDNMLYVYLGSTARPEIYGAAQILPVDEATLSVGRAVDLQPSEYSFTVNRGVAYVSDPAANRMDVVDVSDPTSRSMIDGVGRGLGAMQISGDDLWCASATDNTVTRVRLAR